MADLSVYSTLGALGVLLYLGAYAALQLGWLKGASSTYTILNLLAASSVLASLLEEFNLFSALIQIFWVLISIFGLSRRALQKARLRFTEEERSILARHFGALPLLDARRLLDLGQWDQLDPGAAVTERGTPPEALLCLTDGTAEVRRDDMVIATLGPGALIGEMTVMHGGPATADVSAQTPIRLLRLPRQKLLRAIEQNETLALSLSHALQAEAMRKINSMNQRDAGPIPVPVPAKRA
jgi:CRP-like cAMP-binding protein